MSADTGMLPVGMGLWEDQCQAVQERWLFFVCAAADCSYQPPWPVRKHHQLAVGKQKSFNPQSLWVGCLLEGAL